MVCIKPSLRLVKAINGGTALPSDFVLTLTGADGIHDNGVNYASGAEPEVKPGVTYRLTEAPGQVPDYFEEGVACVDDSDQSAVPHPVTLQGNQSVTCTLTNRLDEIYEVVAEACINNAPLVGYTVTTAAGSVNEVDITWIKNDGSDEVVETLLDAPSEGTLLWPGAKIVDGVTVAWPGWLCDENGSNCTQVDDGLVPTMQLRFDINPTKTLIVNYPPATEGCQPTPTFESIPSNNPLALLLLTLMLLATGWYFRPANLGRF